MKTLNPSRAIIKSVCGLILMTAGFSNGGFWIAGLLGLLLTLWGLLPAFFNIVFDSWAAETYATLSDKDAVVTESSYKIQETAVDLKDYLFIRILAGLMVSVPGIITPLIVVVMILKLGMMIHGHVQYGGSPDWLFRTKQMLAWAALGGFLPGFIIGFGHMKGERVSAPVRAPMLLGIGLLLTIFLGIVNYWVMRGEWSVIALCTAMGAFGGGYVWLSVLIKLGRSPGKIWQRQ